MSTTGKIYFASDFHLGLDVPHEPSMARERKIVTWLDSIQHPDSELYLVGDVFDYWFEYKSVIPKGFTRFLGKIAEMQDNGMRIYFMVGNHDMWMFRYLEDEMGIPIIRSPLIKNLRKKKFYIAHGDGLGEGDMRYKTLKSIFSNRHCQWFFERIHPNLGMIIMKYGSKLSRNSHNLQDYQGPEKEKLLQYAEHLCEISDVDYFIFGHRHLPISTKLKNGKSQYINLGDWIHFRSYAEFCEDRIYLKFFENENLRFYT